MEAIATCNALESIRGSRCFVLSRSTFPGSGAHTGHWTGMLVHKATIILYCGSSSGDNRATFDDLYYSIPEMLSFQMYGIPLVGSDICGFNGEYILELSVMVLISVTYTVVVRIGVCMCCALNTLIVQSRCHERYNLQILAYPCQSETVKVLKFVYLYSYVTLRIVFATAADRAY